MGEPLRLGLASKEQRWGIVGASGRVALGKNSASKTFQTAGRVPQSPLGGHVVQRCQELRGADTFKNHLIQSVRERILYLAGGKSVKGED